jgi:serine protease AprX
VGLAIVLACTLGATTPVWAAGPGDHPKLDKTLNGRATQPGKSRVIVMLNSGWSADTQVKSLGGKLGRSLSLINGTVVELPNGMLRRLADYPGVSFIADDRPTGGEMNRVAVTVGARAVQQNYGLRGAGVGVAVIDSGISGWNNDLAYFGSSSLVQTRNYQRVVGFVDFVNGWTTPYDDNGHGTHVAGIIGGNGFNSLGVRAGIAPDAHMVSLKVLDAEGRGVISNVIAALDWVVAHKAQYNLRVINLSVGAAVTMSYNVDPLTLAAKRAVDSGIVLVTAAGNLGYNRTTGTTQYGGITAPGNAPWVLTVGASNHQGTVDRSDDTIAPFSSRGPSAVDYQAKPDIVAPGVGTVSLSDQTSRLYSTMSPYLLSGSFWMPYKPYLSLTGTSMSSPVVAGSVALMLQANPELTPNLVKAILEYTAQPYPGYNALTEGAGFLNTKGAIDLARYFATATNGSRYPHPAEWGKTFIWGNFKIRRGVISPRATAWQTGVTWGSPSALSGANVVWGTRCDDECDNVVWGTASEVDDNVVWGTGDPANPTCDPQVENCDNVVWGTSSATDPVCDPQVENCDNVVWGTFSDGDDNVVWGTSCGRANCRNVVWGTASDGDDNVVWGTASDGDDNVVWGTSGDVDLTVWNDGDDNVTWGTSGTDDIPLYDDPEAAPACFDGFYFESLFGFGSAEPVEQPVPGSGGIL